jgi:predicted SprT family Zn-dependent metalloprotease
VRSLVNELFGTFHLQGWSFKLNRRRREMGLCSYDASTIALSIHFIELNDWDAIRDTLLHEIAHALVGPGHGHGPVWKSKAREIGAQPFRLCNEVNMPEGTWQAQCGCCGMIHHKFRRPKHFHGWHCRHCGREKGKLCWQKQTR